MTIREFLLIAGWYVLMEWLGVSGWLRRLGARFYEWTVTVGRD